jgi:opacity protein-like surface antigen
MMNRFSKIAPQLVACVSIVIAAVAVAVAVRGGGSIASAQGPAAAPRPQTGLMPTYDSSGALRLPDGYRQWVLAGSSLGLSYSEGAVSGMGMEMFNETLIEPSAYKHFVETGTFREGTMLALILHGQGQNALPARRGRFAADIHGVEMAVKDSSHRPEGWAYYNFGGMTGIRSTAQANPKENCYNCHKEHAKRDNVFMQYYTLLSEAAPQSTTKP